MKHLIDSKKHLFHKCIQDARQCDRDYVTCDNTLSYDEVITDHFNSWIQCRIKGVSSSLGLQDMLPSIIRLLDEIAIEHFTKT